MKFYFYFQANYYKMHTIMLEQLSENEFEILDLLSSDVRMLLINQDLNATKLHITKDHYLITVRYFKTSYQAVIKSLSDLGYCKDGKDPYFPECEYLVTSMI